MTQYIVAAFLDGTLNVDAAGPFRSAEAAQAACDLINKAGEWSEADEDVATIVAQVVALRPAKALAAEAASLW